MPCELDLVPDPRATLGDFRLRVGGGNRRTVCDLNALHLRTLGGRGPPPQTLSHMERVGIECVESSLCQVQLGALRPVARAKMPLSHPMLEPKPGGAGQFQPLRCVLPTSPPEGAGEGPLA